MKNDKKLKNVNGPTKIYQFDDYRDFIKNYLSEKSSTGRGEYQKLAKEIRVHTTLVSQVLGGKKDFSLEQGLAISRYFSLSKKEEHFFMLLLQKDKAGSKDLKDYFLLYIEDARRQFMTVGTRLKDRQEITKEAQAFYYSDWHVMAIWIATSLGGKHTVLSIANRLDLDHNTVQSVLDFLCQYGLCIEEEGNYSIGISSTHIDLSSSFINRHHKNWRLKAMEKFGRLAQDELAFTAPISLSKNDLNNLKKMILNFIEKCGEIVSLSPAEEMACLNIDLFRI